LPCLAPACSDLTFPYLCQGVSGDLKLLSAEQVENVGLPLSVFFQQMQLL